MILHVFRFWRLICIYSLYCKSGRPSLLRQLEGNATWIVKFI